VPSLLLIAPGFGGGQFVPTGPRFDATTPGAGAGRSNPTALSATALRGATGGLSSGVRGTSANPGGGSRGVDGSTGGIGREDEGNVVAGGG
jgi:hypothetical protein